MDTIKHDGQLDELAQSYAEDIYNELKQYGGEAYDLAHQYADSSEHVIYYYKAHAICQNCNTANGEAFIEDCGPPQDNSYDGMAVALAFGELHARIIHAYDELVGELGDPEDEPEEELELAHA